MSADLVYLVVGMVVVVVITIALVRAPRRKHDWED